MDNPCKQFETFINFEAFVNALRNAYDNNVTAAALQGCKDEICSTLYSTGNSDVSGIGVIVGYYLEFALALILGVSLLLFEFTGRKSWSAICNSITAAYADSAIALALAVELACSIMLVKKNFGLGVDDFGALTVQIVWVVALLVLLPITTFCWQDLKDKKFELRLCMVSLAFILFLITFVSRMISTYSKGQIGSGSGAVVTQPELQQIEQLCLSQPDGLSSSASTIMEVFSVGGSLWASCLVVSALARQYLYETRNTTATRLKRLFAVLKDEKRMLMVNLTGLIFWSSPLFWVLMKLRKRQEDFAADLGKPDGSETWSFGQILAVVVFVPVLVEILNQYLRRHELPVSSTNTTSSNRGSPLANDGRQWRTW